MGNMHLRSGNTTSNSNPNSRYRINNPSLFTSTATRVQKRAKTPAKPRARRFGSFSNLPLEIRTRIWREHPYRRLLTLRRLVPLMITPNGHYGLSCRAISINAEHWNAIRSQCSEIYSYNEISYRGAFVDIDFHPLNDTIYFPPLEFHQCRAIQAERVDDGFDNWPRSMALHMEDFDAANRQVLRDMWRYEDISLIVGVSKGESRTKVVVPGERVTFGRPYRGDGTVAEFEDRKRAVWDFASRMERHFRPGGPAVAAGGTMPTLRIMMLDRRGDIF